VQTVDPADQFANLRVVEIFTAAALDFAIDDRELALLELSPAFGDALDEGVEVAAGQVERKPLVGEVVLELGHDRSCSGDAPEQIALPEAQVERHLAAHSQAMGHHTLAVDGIAIHRVADGGN